MSAEKQQMLFESLLISKMKADGFKKKRKNVFQKEITDCIIQLTLCTNKVRNEDAIVQTYVIGFIYPAINSIIYYLICEYFSSKWSTGRVALCKLMSPADKENGLPNTVKNGYNHKLDDSMDIPLLSAEVYTNLKKYAFPYWDKYNSLNKLLTGLEECRPELNGWAIHCSDVTRMACHISKGDIEKAIALGTQRLELYKQGMITHTDVTWKMIEKINSLPLDSTGKVIIPKCPPNTMIRK